jgi:alanine racemase
MNKIIINTKNLVYNIKRIKEKLNNKLFCAVVKADAYGHGIENIVPFIDEYVDYYAVANVKEGVLLRELTYKRILVLGSFLPDEIELACGSDLTLSVCSDLRLKWLIDANKAVKIHIKVNSGMNRLGFSVDELEDVKHKIDGASNIILEGIFSHIFDNDNSESLCDQKNIFDKSIAIFGENIITHLSSSGGIDKIKDYKMVRVGIAMYGYPQGKKTMSIESTVVQITKINAGEKVGYGGRYTAKEEEYIATVPLGYYDGVPLALSNKGHVYIKGQKCPIVGRVCMDMMMIKVPTNVCEGDYVLVFWSAKNWAKIKGVHEWEILTSIKKNRLRVVFR